MSSKSLSVIPFNPQLKGFPVGSNIWVLFENCWPGHLLIEFKPVLQDPGKMISVTNFKTSFKFLLLSVSQQGSLTHCKKERKWLEMQDIEHPTGTKKVTMTIV